MDKKPRHRGLGTGQAGSDSAPIKRKASDYMEDPNYQHRAHSEHRRLRKGEAFSSGAVPTNTPPTLRQQAWAHYVKENLDRFFKAPYDVILEASFYAYDHNKVATAITTAERHLNNPKVMRLLFQNSALAEQKLIDLLNSGDPKLEFQVAAKVLEFVHGKPGEAKTIHAIEGEVVGEQDAVEELESLRPKTKRLKSSKSDE